MFEHLTRNKLHIKENLGHFARNFAENFILKIEKKTKPSFEGVLTDHRINRSFKKKHNSHYPKKFLKIINPNYQ